MKYMMIILRSFDPCDIFTIAMCTKHARNEHCIKELYLIFVSGIKYNL
jgi:hypothetical protein